MKRLCVLVLVAVSSSAVADARTLAEYRTFRSLVVDLAGRIPTRDELQAFERPDFSLDAFIEKQLLGPSYGDRLTRVYMDLLRLEVGPAFTYAPPLTTLRRAQVLGPDGKPLYVYYRNGQRRGRVETDGDFCLTLQESGVQLFPNGQLKGAPHAISRAALDANTVVVRPWWLYRDFREPQPMLLYKQSWERPDPLYQPVDELLVDADKRRTVDIVVCKEEAQTAESGHFYLTGRAPPPPGTPPPYDRVRPLPVDDGYAKAHRDDPVSCRSALGLTLSKDCGCGAALEYCMPGTDMSNDPRAFALPTHVPIGLDQPVDTSPQNVSAWQRLWWSQEAIRFFSYVFAGDRDFREVLTARYSLVNGPLVQFYKASEPASCCGREKAFNMTQEAEPLFDSKRLPDLLPSDLRTWKLVADRGSHAAGLLTMPVFLTKYASRRARAATLYAAFLCKSFTAGNAQLIPSTESNLMVRPGCATCHQTLEPLAAYFSRVEETGWTYLPEWQFPLRSFNCKRDAKGKIPGYCETFYDPAFSDGTAGLLRGAYASIENAAAGPIGAAHSIVVRPEFASCAVERVTSSFLGRPMSIDDATLLGQLTKVFVDSGYKMRALVRAIVHAPVYRDASALREGAR